MIVGSLKISVPSMVTRPLAYLLSPGRAGALRAAESETSPLIADRVIRERKDRAFLHSIINDSDRIGYVTDKIEEAIGALGARVVSELTRFRNVNRVLLTGGGAPLIEESIRRAPLAADRIEVIREPQLALAREIALFKMRADRVCRKFLSLSES